MRADDERAARLLFQPEVLDFFEHLDAAYDQTIEGAGECVAVYRVGWQIGLTGARAFVDEETAVASLFGSRGNTQMDIAMRR